MEEIIYQTSEDWDMFTFPGEGRALDKMVIIEKVEDIRLISLDQPTILGTLTQDKYDKIMAYTIKT